MYLKDGANANLIKCKLVFLGMTEINRSARTKGAIVNLGSVSMKSGKIILLFFI